MPAGRVSIPVDDSRRLGDRGSGGLPQDGLVRDGPGSGGLPRDWGDLDWGVRAPGDSAPGALAVAGSEQGGQAGGELQAWAP